LVLFQVLVKLLNWPLADLLPVYDIVRVVVTHSNGAERLNAAFPTLIQATINVGAFVGNFKVVVESAQGVQCAIIEHAECSMWLMPVRVKSPCTDFCNKCNLLVIVFWNFSFLLYALSMFPRHTTEH
jgi:hypothetical protein